MLNRLFGRGRAGRPETVGLRSTLLRLCDRPALVLARKPGSPAPPMRSTAYYAASRPTARLPTGRQISLITCVKPCVRVSMDTSSVVRRREFPTAASHSSQGMLITLNAQPQGHHHHRRHLHLQPCKVTRRKSSLQCEAGLEQGGLCLRVVFAPGEGYQRSTSAKPEPVITSDGKTVSFWASRSHGPNAHLNPHASRPSASVLGARLCQ
jgi:hypothetical protein